MFPAISKNQTKAGLYFWFDDYPCSKYIIIFLLVNKLVLIANDVFLAMCMVASGIHLVLCYRELPNPLCTYQLYQSFVNAVQGCSTSTRSSENDHERLLKMREAVQKLPPPHYR